MKPLLSAKLHLLVKLLTYQDLIFYLSHKMLLNHVYNLYNFFQLLNNL